MAGPKVAPAKPTKSEGGEEPQPEEGMPVVIDGVELGAPHTWPFIAHQTEGDKQLSAKFRERPDAAFPPDPRWDAYQGKEHEWEASLPPVTEGIASFDLGPDPTDDSVVESLLAALGRDGAVVLTGLVGPELCAQIESDMAPYVPHVATADDNAKRLGSLLARSPASHDLVAHPVLTRLSDALIGRQVLRMDALGCERLTRGTPGSSTPESAPALAPSNPANFVTEEEEEEEEGSKGKGEGAAKGAEKAAAAAKKVVSEKVEMPKMGEDDGEDGPMDMPGEGEGEEAPRPAADNLSRTLMQVPWGLDVTQLVVRGAGAPEQPLNYNGAATIWDLHEHFEHKIEVAISTDDSNSMPTVIAGSHKWPRDRDPHPSEAVTVAVPKGGALITVASTWHGAQEGASSVLRVGYNASLLRSEENMFVSNPPEIAKNYPDHIQRLCGYTVRGANCGTFCDFQHPREALLMATEEGFEEHHCVDWARPENRANLVETTVLPKEEQTPHCFAEADHARWDSYEQNRYEWIRTLPPAGSGPIHFKWDPSDPKLFEKLVAALDRDGCVILEEAVSPDMCQQIMHDMEPYVDCARARSESRRRRNGNQRSVRADALPARSEASWDIVAHPALMAISEAVLGRQVCNMTKAELVRRMRSRAEQLPWLLNLTQIIQVSPGSGHQGLHRDDGVFAWDHSVLGNLEYELSTIWALHEFTAEIGATRVVPGSHRWPPYRKPTDEEAFQAVMPAGSCVIYTGKTFHSSAANTTEDPRWGLNVDYLPAFVTEEEIAILSHPPHAAKRTPEHINRLCGYDVFGPQLGHYGDMQHPTELLGVESRPLDWATAVAPKM